MLDISLKNALPPLPDRPKKWPTAMLMEVEKTQYLPSLVASGWRVAPLEPSEDLRQSPHLGFFQCLTKTFTLKHTAHENTRDMESKFMNRIKDLERKEKVRA